MTDDFHARLNGILPRLMSEELLANKGQGNEIGYWIFDYPVERELEMRSFLEDVVLPALRKRQPPLRYEVVNLFELIIGLLEERNLYDRVIDMQQKQGNEAVLRSLIPVLKEDKLAARITSTLDVDNADMLILTGVGAAYPMLRSHTLLNALQATMKKTPLVMFYPGRYDGFSLRLFNTLTDENYYRAFRLVE